MRWGVMFTKKYYSENSFTVVLKHVCPTSHTKESCEGSLMPPVHSGLCSSALTSQTQRAVITTAEHGCSSLLHSSRLTPDCSGNTDELQSKGTFKILKNISWDKKFCRLWWNMTDWVNLFTPAQSSFIIYVQCQGNTFMARVQFIIRYRM